MQPSTQKKIETSAGPETALETVTRIQNRLSELGSVPVDVMENPPQQLDLPQVEPDIPAANGTVTATQRFLNEQTTALQQAREAESLQTDTVRELQTQLLGRGVEQQELEDRAGVGRRQKELNELLSRITASTADLEAFDDDTFLGEQSLRQEMGARGGTTTDFSAAANQRRLQRAVQRTGAAATVRGQVAAAQLLEGNLESARDEIDRAMNLKYGVVEQALGFEQAFLERAMTRADGAQQDQLQARMGVIQQQEQQIADAKALVATVAGSGYASTRDIETLMSLDPEQQTTMAMGMLAEGAAADRAFDQRPTGGSGGGVSVSIDSDSDPDSMVSLLEATAGGRALTQSETEPLTNARRVTDQLDSIIDGVVAENTGPILGIIRSNNPYDVKAQDLEAQLIAIVPQLARGIYGEVGVLTDTDVARYVQTLPNISSTQDVNKAVAGLTLRNVRSAFVAQLESMAAAGRDVSGFVGIYQNMNNRINELESQLGVGQGTQQIDDEYDNLFNQPEAGTQSDENIGMGAIFRPQGGRSVWSTIGKALFGE